MQIVEARLKEIVLEEVHSRLVERQWQQFRTAMREELAKEGIHLTEEELEEAMSDKWKRRMATLGAGAALAGGIVGTELLLNELLNAAKRLTNNGNRPASKKNITKKKAGKLKT